MSALQDIQHALNTLRSITHDEQAAVRLEVLRLMATAIADEARDIEQSAAPKQSSQQQQQQPKTQPIQPINPIAPKQCLHRKTM